MKVGGSWLASELPWALGAILGSLLLLVFFRGSSTSTGDRFRVSLTIVPNDIDDLDCDLAAAGSSAERCAFSAGRRDASVRHPLRPFVSTSGELLILGGVFESPKVAEWVDAARRARSRERVTLDCDVRYLGDLASVGVRFRDGAPFEVRGDVRSGKAETCSVRGAR